MRPRARLISLVGDELISDEPVAIVELVKNSYDADASQVEIRFEGGESGKLERIVVADVGIGMDLETVLDCWFEPGTISKRRNARSPGGRLFLGAKGIGRFASARLAENLALESRAKGQEGTVFVLLHWGRFTDESYLDEIEIDYEVRRARDNQHGTTLILEQLRKTDWGEKDFERLHARLTRLISPFQEISDFRILLNIPDYPQYSGEVQPPELILKPKYVLKGKLDDDGCFTGNILVDRQERKSFLSHKITGGNAKPLCGSFEVEVRAWDRDREGLGPLSESFGMGIQEIRRTLNNLCGVSVYRDGFRIHPYGEQGNDWLNLDHRSRQNPVLHLANNQMISAIRISREKNPELRDRSTREGMVLNEEHRALEIWFKGVLSLLEEERYRIRPRRKEEDDRVEPLFEALDIAMAASTARKELGKDHPVALMLSDTEKQVKIGIERVQEVFSRLLMSAGLGQMVDIVIHEIGAPLGKVNRQVVLIEKDMDKYCLEETKRLFFPKITDVKGWLEQIHNLRGRLEPQTPAKRGRATSFLVQEEIEDNFHLYESLLQKQGIKWQIEAQDSVSVKMSRASLGQILANLIDNSIYWIVDSKGSGNGGRIHVRLKPHDHGFRILFSDDGPGVPEEDQSRIFEPYFSTKRGGSGMGLGLYICRLVIEPYGKILYRDDVGKLLGACFEILFERKVGR